MKTVTTRLNLHLMSVTVSAIGLRGIGAILTFFANIIIVRLLSISDAGMYFVSLSIVVILSAIGRAGLDYSILRIVSNAAVKKQANKINSAFFYAMLIAIIINTILMLSLIFSVPHVFEMTKINSNTVEIVTLVTPAIIFYSMWMLLGEFLKSVKKSTGLMIISSIIFPLMNIAIAVYLVPIMGVSGAVLSFVISTGFVSLLCAGYWALSVQMRGPFRDRVVFKQMIRSSLRLFPISVTNEAIVPWLPLLLVFFWSGAESTGVFGAVTRVSALMLAFIMLFNTIFTPYCSQLMSEGNYEEVVRTARRLSLLSLIVVLPGVILMLFFSSSIMSVFGVGFQNGGLALAVIVVGRLIQLIFGSAMIILIVMESDIALQVVYCSSAIVLVVCAAVFVPVYHDVGGAIAGAAALVVSSVGSLVAVYRRTGLLIYPRW